MSIASAGIVGTAATIGEETVHFYFQDHAVAGLLVAMGDFLASYYENEGWGCIVWWSQHRSCHTMMEEETTMSSSFALVKPSSLTTKSRRNNNSNNNCSNLLDETEDCCDRSGTERTESVMTPSTDFESLDESVAACQPQWSYRRDKPLVIP